MGASSSASAAKELASELEGLTAADKAMLQAAIDDLAVGGPKTELAASRFKRLLARASNEGAAALRRIVVDILSEAARKLLLGP
jgi:hypothetical protein